MLNYGEGSSPMPSGENSGENPSHHNPNFFNTVLNPEPYTDTDKLADYLEYRRGNIYVSNAGIKFSRSPTVNPFNEYFSRIARYVRANHNDVFYRIGPNNTPINDQLISRIRSFRENVPINFQ
jgi:hypothetical protein